MATSDERLRDATPTATDFDPGAAGSPPARARAVVVGGGIIGASVAYHLARLGWTDVVVLERSRVSSGTSWHAAGLMTRTRGTHVQTDLASYSRDFYQGLAALSGVDIGYHPSGSLSVARTPERMVELGYGLTMAHHHGLPARRVTPDEIAAVSPLLAVDDLAGGVLFEQDATVNPGIATYATAKAAFDLGVRFVEDVRVTGFRLEGDRVTGVETDRGPVDCEVAVIAAGLWSRDLALLAGVRLPLHAAEHYWAQTEPMDGASRDLPIVRDLDGYFYLRHYRGGLIVGAFEPDGRPRTTASIPEDFSFGEFEPDLGHFELPLSRARRRVPALAEARFAHFLDAPESFTPDANFLLGETAEVAGLFVAAGMNSQGIIFGPGVGRALAEWIDEDAPTIDASDLDVRRFSPAQANAGYLFERTRESLGRLYAMHWPFLQPATARGLRRVPLYDRLAAAGACFGETAGWERADWYGPAGSRPEYEYSFGRQNWFGAVAGEHRAAREDVVLFDLSSFAKLRVEGPAALAAVQRVFSADLDRPPGSMVYTSMLNERGGIELDATVTRLAGDLFFVVAPTAAQARTFHWLRRLGDPAAVVTDVTSGLGTLAVTGPRSRELLGRLTGAGLATRCSRSRRRRRSTSAGRRRWRCASRSPESWAGSCTPRSSRWPRSTTSSSKLERTWAFGTPATAPSTDCAARRGTSIGASTWGRPTRRSRPAYGRRSPWTSPAASSAARRWSRARTSHSDGGSRTSCSRTPGRSSTTASLWCATAPWWAASLRAPTAIRSAPPWHLPGSRESRPPWTRSSRPATSRSRSPASEYPRD